MLFVRVCMCLHRHKFLCMDNQSIKMQQMDMCPPLQKHTMLNEVEVTEYCVCVCV